MSGLHTATEITAAAIISKLPFTLMIAAKILAIFVAPKKSIIKLSTENVCTYTSVRRTEFGQSFRVQQLALLPPCHRNEEW